MTLLEAITGRPPGRPRGPGELDRPRLPRGVPVAVAEMLSAMVALEPAERPEPREVAEVLGTALAALPRGRLAGPPR